MNLRYDPKELQQLAEKLGSWNKLMSKTGISPKTITSYKHKGLITNIPQANDKIHIDKKESQVLYDNGMSYRKLALHYGVSKSVIQGLSLIPRTKSESSKLSNKNNPMSEEARKKLSDIAKTRSKEGTLGGYRPHPNKGTRYKGIWFDSSYELIVAKELDKHCVAWERPKKGFVYKEGKRYYPDFYLIDYDVYLDPKNDYLIPLHKEKINKAMEVNSIQVLVLTEKQLTWNEIKKLL